MKYFLVIAILFLSACSVHNYKQTHQKIVIIKSSQLKFADLGYIRNSGSSIELELFVAGKAIEKITIDNFICTNEGCMSKTTFNKEYLNKEYPNDILQNILLGKAIYKGLNKQVILDGFEQRITTDNVDIVYKVNTKVVFFKDRKNRIIIKIKELNQRGENVK